MLAVEWGNKKANTRRAAFRRALNSPDDGHSAFFRTLRDRARPTSVLRINGELTSNLTTIHQEFHRTWDKVYTRLADSPPCFDDFYQKYQHAFHGKPAGDLRPTADQLHKTARSARQDAPAGRDGWRPAELSLLPLFAWRKGKILLDLIIEEGRWPDAYVEVSSPCLRKAEKLNPASTEEPPGVLDHRLLSVYTQLYRIR